MRALVTRRPRADGMLDVTRIPDADLDHMAELMNERDRRQFGTTMQKSRLSTASRACYCRYVVS